MELAYPLNSTSLQSIPIRSAIKSIVLLRNGAMALGVTGLLLFGMSQLIATDLQEPPVEESPTIAPIHLPELKPTVIRETRVAKPQELPPPITPTTVEHTLDPGDMPIIFQPPTTTGTKVDTSIVTANPMPIYKPAPRYPRRAMAKGVEGYVVVEFTISKNGSVKNPSVVGGYDASGAPTDVFNQSALRAVERFKYRPTVVDGKPVEKHGVRNRISYKLAN
ncbi:energy transducer TonB [Microbulbifer agarilyticus]|uniref:energy transducer TonB n=1 Tax=Microbulbifer agarilyticus TaxID=260552 RepID=UPI001CD29C0F|nr:energy transducer TonB [Microbulbifer agarilyticus]MCA0899626.1 TonB family protein [Microbulbifer agarilyticus]